MALPINIEDLLNKRKIEGNRIEFKRRWNVTEVERRASLIGMPRWSIVIEYNPVETAMVSTTETTTETTTEKIIRIIKENPYITNKELAAYQPFRPKGFGA